MSVAGHWQELRAHCRTESSNGPAAAQPGPAPWPPSQPVSLAACPPVTSSPSQAASFGSSIVSSPGQWAPVLCPEGSPAPCARQTQKTPRVTDLRRSSLRGRVRSSGRGQALESPTQRKARHCGRGAACRHGADMLAAEDRGPQTERGPAPRLSGRATAAHDTLGDPRNRHHFF